MPQRTSIADIRREYGCLSLDEATIPSCPMALFQAWFSEILQSEQYDPTAMVLSSVDAQGDVDSRVVLLKGIEKDQFLFFTNYESPKALQLQHHPHVALNFYWPSMARQVRIRGVAQKTSREQSQAYFASRPIESQWSAIVSQQSAVIHERAVLERAFQALHDKPQPITPPDNWGGYGVTPTVMEFWQGRDNRLHDRIQYVYEANVWKSYRLAP